MSAREFEIWEEENSDTVLRYSERRCICRRGNKGVRGNIGLAPLCLVIDAVGIVFSFSLKP
jgi:hypothetical protein